MSFLYESLHLLLAFLDDVNLFGQLFLNIIVDLVDANSLLSVQQTLLCYVQRVGCCHVSFLQHSLVLLKLLHLLQLHVLRIYVCMYPHSSFKFDFSQIPLT